MAPWRKRRNCPELTVHSFWAMIPRDFSRQAATIGNAQRLCSLPGSANLLVPALWAAPPDAQGPWRIGRTVEGDRWLGTIMGGSVTPRSTPSRTMGSLRRRGTTRAAKSRMPIRTAEVPHPCVRQLLLLFLTLLTRCKTTNKNGRGAITLPAHCSRLGDFSFLFMGWTRSRRGDCRR